MGADDENWDEDNPDWGELMSLLPFHYRIIIWASNHIIIYTLIALLAGVAIGYYNYENIDAFVTKWTIVQDTNT